MLATMNKGKKRQLAIAPKKFRVIANGQTKCLTFTPAEKASLYTHSASA